VYICDPFFDMMQGQPSKLLDINGVMRDINIISFIFGE
jgi:hypothetical protein